MKTKLVIGLNSGTSMDGVDAGIFKMDLLEYKEQQTPKINIETGSTLLFPMKEHFRDKLKKLIASHRATLEEICLLNAAIGEIFAQAALAVIEKAGLRPSDIDLIGSHGQTIWHAPNKTDFWGMPVADTLQLGDPSIISMHTGVPVIADFRTLDIAYGGQGAPLVSFADEVLFGKDGIATGVLNLGGIANITIIDKAGKAKMAFDTGPGNVLIDYACQALFNSAYDQNGKHAANGCIDLSWLHQLLNEPYFGRCPPKTTGRELFSESYARNLVKKAKFKGLSKQDCIATITALTAYSIASAYRSYISENIKIERLILGGGGAENVTLIQMLKDAWPHTVDILTHERFAISTKFKEAMLFALLAYTTYIGIPNNVPSCTGAGAAICLGHLIQPNKQVLY